MAQRTIIPFLNDILDSGYPEIESLENASVYESITTATNMRKSVVDQMQKLMDDMLRIQIQTITADANMAASAGSRQLSNRITG